MSIPYLFEPVQCGGDYLVDGGVLDNYPLHIFDGKFPGDPNARLNLCPPNPKVLGINIISNQETDNYHSNERKDISNIIDYSITFITTFLTENERRVMTPSYWHRTINLITPSYPLTHFTLTQNQKDYLIKLGSVFVQKFFDE